MEKEGAAPRERDREREWRKIEKYREKIEVGEMLRYEASVI